MIAGKIQKLGRLNGSASISLNGTPRVVLSVFGNFWVSAQAPNTTPEIGIIAISVCQLRPSCWKKSRLSRPPTTIPAGHQAWRMFMRPVLSSG
jgi:hypothetical protein